MAEVVEFPGTPSDDTETGTVAAVTPGPVPKRCSRPWPLEHGGHHAAMEPALIGGSTRPDSSLQLRDGAAAMEPAVDLRERGGRPGAGDLRGQAAMEPAIGQREHDDQAGRDLYLVIAAMEPAVPCRNPGCKQS